MRCLSAFFLGLFLLSLSPPLWSQESSSSTIREQTQSELLTLKIRLISLGKTIAVLRNQIETLSKQLQDSEDRSETLEKQLQESKNLLATQEQEYETLSQQLADLKSSLLKSKIEVGLICGGIGVAVGVAVVTIIALASK